MINSAATVAFGLPTSFGLQIESARYVPIIKLWGVPEQELSIEIADIDRVHVNNMDILEPRKREIGENLTAETTGPNNQDFALVA